jgi:hypothetical protein
MHQLPRLVLHCIHLYVCPFGCAVVDADLKLPRFHVDPHLVFDMNCRMLPFAYARYQMIRDAYHLQLRRRFPRTESRSPTRGAGPIAQGRRST